MKQGEQEVLHARDSVGQASGATQRCLKPGFIPRNWEFETHSWASWEDWFAVAGNPAGVPRRLGLDSYTYVLGAAAAGHCLALGWRYFIERPLESGALVALGDGFVEFDRAYYACSPRRDAASRSRAGAWPSSTAPRSPAATKTAGGADQRVSATVVYDMEGEGQDGVGTLPARGDAGNEGVIRAV